MKTKLIKGNELKNNNNEQIVSRQELINILKERKIWITKNRIQILNFLNTKEHFLSVSDILNKSKSINAKSVYNNIKILIEHGIIDTYSFNGVSKYALNDELIGHKKSIHIINAQNDIDHIEMDSSVFDKIKNNVAKENNDIKSIKIFVHLK